MGIATVSIKKRASLAPGLQTRIVDITLSSSYATGGDTVRLNDLELRELEALVLTGNNGGYTMEVVHGAAKSADPKIKLYEDKATAAATPLSEEGAGVNVSSVTVRAIAYGDGWHTV